MSDDNRILEATLFLFLFVLLFAGLYLAFGGYYSIESSSSENITSTSVSGGLTVVSVEVQIQPQIADDIDRIHLVTTEGRLVDQQQMQIGVTAVSLHPSSAGEYKLVLIDDDRVVERHRVEIKRHHPWEDGIL